MPVKLTHPEAIEERPLEEQPLGAEALPITPCRVAYLGTMRNKSVSLPGRILVEEFQEGEDAHGTPVTTRRYEATAEGNTHYEFSTHDTRGRLIPGRCLGKALPPSLAHLSGRPAAPVMHPDHLFDFNEKLGPDGSHEYQILAKPDQHAALQDYFRRLRARRRTQGALVAYATGAGPAEPEG